MKNLIRVIMGNLIEREWKKRFLIKRYKRYEAKRQALKIIISNHKVMSDIRLKAFMELAGFPLMRKFSKLYDNLIKYKLRWKI